MNRTYKSMYRNMLWRTVVTVLVGCFALIGSLLYVGFYAIGLSLLQKIIIVLVALIAAGAVITLVWMTGWSQYVGKLKGKDWQQWK
jgi:VIT1/CCC1 family predicted Fe2+/Mn2+ transporter